MDAAGGDPGRGARSARGRPAGRRDRRTRRASCWRWRWDSGQASSVIPARPEPDAGGARARASARSRRRCIRTVMERVYELLGDPGRRPSSTCAFRSATRAGASARPSGGRPPRRPTSTAGAGPCPGPAILPQGNHVETVASHPFNAADSVPSHVGHPTAEVHPAMQCLTNVAASCKSRCRLQLLPSYAAAARRPARVPTPAESSPCSVLPNAATLDRPGHRLAR